jgi:hypothetical protein
MILEVKQRYGEPSKLLCAVDNTSMTHDLRSRQLPTNHNLARLTYGRVIREYQFDSPSRKASLSGSGLSRDGPNGTTTHNLGT